MANKGVKSIQGPSEIKAGTWTRYKVSEWYQGTPLNKRNENSVTWEVYEYINGKVGNKSLTKKEGKFRFSEKGIGSIFLITAFVYSPNFKSKSSKVITIVPASEKKIVSIKLTDINDKPIGKKPIRYGQKVNVHISTTNMIGQNIWIGLYEDDAHGPGHNKTNDPNKVAEKIIKVGSKGTAYHQFTISPNFKKLANAIIASGNKDEGQTHEYYVTAYAIDRTTTSTSTNLYVINEDYKNKEIKDAIKDKQKPIPKDGGKVVVPVTPKPQNPIKPKPTPKPEIDDSQRGIVEAIVTNVNNKNKYTFGDTLKLSVKTIGIIGNDLKIRVIEDDKLTPTPNDVLFEEIIPIKNDNFSREIKLTKEMQQKGDEPIEGNSQEIFIELTVVVKKSYVKAAKLPVKIETPIVEVAENVTFTKVENTPKPPEKKVCLCEEFDLIWASKVNCEFRKKVVEITKELWPNNWKKMANNLMAVFEWESGGTFKPDVPNMNNSGATGLIQFMPETAKSLLGKEVTIETVPNYYNSTNKKLHNLKRVKEFAHMKAVQQLDYVKKYFEPIKGKELEFVDFYLQVLFPVSSGKPEHVVFADSMAKLDLKNENQKIKDKRVDKYGRNSGLDKNKDGKIMKSEIAESVSKYLTEGEAYKKIEKCENKKEEPPKKGEQKFIIVLDPGHGVTPGNSGTQVRKYKYKDIKTLVSDGKKYRINELPDYVIDDPVKYIVGHNESKDIGYDEDYTEAKYVYDIAVLLKSKLEEIGHEVYLTRSQKATVKLENEANFKYYKGSANASGAIGFRNAVANNFKADYFISIHCDGARELTPKGAHSIYSDATSKQLGTDIMSDYNDFINVLSKSPHHRTDLGVLSTSNKSKMKVLIELGFMTNPKDAKLLINNKTKVVDKIFNGLVTNFNRQPKK